MDIKELVDRINELKVQRRQISDLEYDDSFENKYLNFMTIFVRSFGIFSAIVFGSNLALGNVIPSIVAFSGTLVSFISNKRLGEYKRSLDIDNYQKNKIKQLMLENIDESINNLQLVINYKNGIELSKEELFSLNMYANNSFFTIMSDSPKIISEIGDINHKYEYTDQKFEEDLSKFIDNTNDKNTLINVRSVICVGDKVNDLNMGQKKK